MAFEFESIPSSLVETVKLKTCIPLDLRFKNFAFIGAQQYLKNYRLSRNVPGLEGSILLDWTKLRFRKIENHPSCIVAHIKCKVTVLKLTIGTRIKAKFIESSYGCIIADAFGFVVKIRDENSLGESIEKGTTLEFTSENYWVDDDLPTIFGKSPALIQESAKENDNINPIKDSTTAKDSENIEKLKPKSFAFHEEKENIKQANSSQRTCKEKSKAKLKPLQSNTLKENKYFCDICGSDFKTLSGLKSHERVKHDIGSVYSCDVCDQTFGYLAHLNKHKKHVHDQIKSHKCDICKKDFFSPANLVEHMRIHTGEKPFECEICKRTFNKKGHLTRHANSSVHLKDKKHSCSHCYSTFSAKSGLNKHMKKVHPNDFLVQHRYLMSIFKK
eukprot:TRINITY_DN23778_c0_g2_i5.p1 TRINITY_DN23778_c0_g2~~TRINITY_DN23778_c0_g2_i5.p1  ORF type:complete len:387 (+),score=23.75 TRINITY_DN23778_c0_g2_i5:60-1220(+)